MKMDPNLGTRNKLNHSITSTAKNPSVQGYILTITHQFLRQNHTISHRW